MYIVPKSTYIQLKELKELKSRECSSNQINNTLGPGGHVTINNSTKCTQKEQLTSTEIPYIEDKIDSITTHPPSSSNILNTEEDEEEKTSSSTNPIQDVPTSYSKSMHPKPSIPTLKPSTMKQGTPVFPSIPSSTPVFNVNATSSTLPAPSIQAQRTSNMEDSFLNNSTPNGAVLESTAGNNILKHLNRIEKEAFNRLSKLFNQESDNLRNFISSTREENMLFKKELASERQQNADQMQHTLESTCNYLTELNNGFDAKMKLLLKDNSLSVLHALQNQEDLVQGQMELLHTSVNKIQANNSQNDGDQERWKSQLLEDARSMFQPLMNHLREASNAFAGQQNLEWVTRLDDINNHIRTLSSRQGEDLLRMFNEHRNDIEEQLRRELTAQFQQNHLNTRNELLSIENSITNSASEGTSYTANNSHITTVINNLNSSLEQNWRTILNEFTGSMDVRMNDMISAVNSQIQNPQSAITNEQPALENTIQDPQLELQGPDTQLALKSTVNRQPSIESLNNPPLSITNNQPDRLALENQSTPRNALTAPDPQLALLPPDTPEPEPEIIGVVENTPPSNLNNIESPAPIPSSSNTSRELQNRRASLSSPLTYKNINKSIAIDQPITDRDKKALIRYKRKLPAPSDSEDETGERILRTRTVKKLQPKPKKRNKKKQMN